MFRFLLFLILVFAIYVVLYGFPIVASIDASVPAGMRGTMASLHASAWAALGQYWEQFKAGLDGLGHALANAFHH